MPSNTIDDLPNPLELTQLPRQENSVKTLWPQILMGLFFACALGDWLLLKNPEGFALTILAGGFFILTVGYIFAMWNQRKMLLKALPWVGGFGFALLFIVISPNLLAASVVCIITGVSYGLAASDRRLMMIGAGGAVGMIILVYALYVAQQLGWFVSGLTVSPFTSYVVLGLMLISISTDVVQRLWRHYNRTDAAFHRLQNANEVLRKTQAELQRRIDERNQLLDASRAVGSTLNLDALLTAILEQLHLVVDYDGASIVILLGDRVRVLCNSGQMEQFGWLTDTHISQTPMRWQRVLNGNPEVVADTRLPGYFEAALLLPPAVNRSLMMAEIGTWLGVPMIVRGKVIGLLAMTHSIAGFFTNQHAELTMAFANQVAVAIEGARARDEAIKSAALAERNRLARDLHDSVSQSLFGITLGLRTAMNDTKQSPTALTFSLDLAETALSEMRALIFELRPESLRDDGLLVAFRKQAAALTARHKIELKMALGEREPEISIEAKEALYRIGLEALQNVIRHAGAKLIQLNVTCTDQLVILEVIDDGRGFNPDAGFPGHLGLRSMRERAEQIGGHLVMDSTIGRGTRVWVTVPNMRG